MKYFTLEIIKPCWIGISTFHLWIISSAVGRNSVRVIYRLCWKYCHLIIVNNNCLMISGRPILPTLYTGNKVSDFTIPPKCCFDSKFLFWEIWNFLPFQPFWVGINYSKNRNTIVIFVLLYLYIQQVLLNWLGTYKKPTPLPKLGKFKFLKSSLTQWLL